MSRPVIALSAGHGLYTAGKRCSKALDPNETREWYLNDRIVDKVEMKLRNYNCSVVRVNDTNGVVDTPLKTRTKTSNNVNASVYIAIHHNAGANCTNAGGTVVFYYSSITARATQAQDLYNSIVKETGLVGNRASKVVKKNYQECREPKAPAFLIENGFMDSRKDTPIILTEAHAEKTANGIVNFLVRFLGLSSVNNVEQKPSTPVGLSTYTVQKGDSLSKIGQKTGYPWKEIAKLNGIKAPAYIVRIGQVLKLPVNGNSGNSSTFGKYVYDGVDYSLVFDPVYYVNKYPDLRNAFGTDFTKLFNHFKTNGMNESRIASANFNVIAYKNRYADLQKAFGNNIPEYYKHYVQFGHKEGRNAL